MSISVKKITLELIQNNMR